MSAASAMNSRANSTLDGWINNLRTFGTQGLEEAARDLVPVVESDLAQHIANGESPDGYKWPKRKDGGQPLKNAMKAITVKAIKNVVLVTLEGPEVFHHFGAGRNPQRPILPIAGMPARLGNAIRKGLVDMGREWMERKGRHDKKGKKGVKMRPSMGGRK